MGAKFARGLLLAAAGESEFASCCNFSFSESNEDEDNVTGGTAESTQFVTNTMEMILTRSTKKLMLTAALVLGVLYLLYRSGGGAAARDCPKTESMSKKTSMISQDGTLYEYDRQSPLIFIGGVPRWVHCSWKTI